MLEAMEVVACAPRPESSWGHLLVLAAFVVAARAFALRRRAPRVDATT